MIFPFANLGMDREETMLSKISQTKTRYHFAHMWNLRSKWTKRKIDKQTKDQTLKYRKQTGGSQREVSRGMGEINKRNYEYTYDEHWEMHRIVELLSYTPKTNIALYVYYTSIKKVIFKNCAKWKWWL